MAAVFQAYDHELRVWRAIKFLSPELAGQDRIRSRFSTEAQTMAAIEDPHIVRVYDVGVEGELPYIVMELATGGCPADWVAEHGPMPVHMALEVAIGVCKGLHAAHKRGITHRDVKPHNVLVDASGRCKVTDFGIAQAAESASLTRTGSVMGTMGFMAPEQRLDAKRTDHRADIYAVGATLFTLLTGQVAGDLFLASNHPEWLATIPDVLHAPILKATAYDREDRYERVVDFALALTMAKRKLPPDPPAPPLCRPLDEVEPPDRGAAATSRPAAPDREAPTKTFDIEPPTPDPAPRAVHTPYNRGAHQWQKYGNTPRPTIAPRETVEVAPKPAPTIAPVAPPVRRSVVEAWPDEAAWLVIHRTCEPKRLVGGGQPMHGIQRITELLDTRAFADSIAAAAQRQGRPPEHVKCKLDARWITVEELAEQTEDLDTHCAECQRCTARVVPEPYGCFVRMPYPVPLEGEAWLMERLQPAGTLGGDLCLDMLASHGIDGRPAADLRVNGGFETRTPIVRVMKKGWLRKTKVSSDQLFHALWMAHIEFLVPYNCLGMALWFGAVTIDGVPAEELTEADLQAVARLSTTHERLQRTEVSLPDPTDEAEAEMQRVLQALHLSWAHEVKLLAEP